ncbi:hypothetical protein HHI36_003810 [Cryptolaemus montrouzieri]|uniref:Uncharacterized protein n=1 Tax=Cryptolaemus montrouzieri TaxID=559131 RepID=A0ABD2NPX8_9CUCU
MFDYFKEVIINAMKTGAHKNSSDPTFQLVFTVVMILEQILTTQDYKLEELKVNEPIKALASETSSSELKVLCEKIISCDCKDQSKMKKEYLQSIVEDVYNESIEIKGHGLIALKRLVLSKDATTYEHRQYIFTIFKENLSYPDSYIYLAAINGLASLPVLGTECTNMVLETLCEEYTNFPKEVFKDDTNEMRLKVGEVLVQISKNLDEMAPTYKALLLNTFLNGTKDEDHLIRASSLSNLGEICKVLGYKLGSIVTEILMCVHSIISTDKHLEPRRAAILVIRQLLTGLGKDMLTVLKDDILVIYRTLKFLYENDGDDVSKLQTQLALEELNKNMKDLIFPQVKIDTINKVVILK